MELFKNALQPAEILEHWLFVFVLTKNILKTELLFENICVTIIK